MSEQEPYGEQPSSGPQYGQQPYGYAPPATTDGQPQLQPQKSNTMAILGFVFAFLFSPLGILFSAIGVKQTRERNESGLGLATTGLIISVLALGGGIFYISIHDSGSLAASRSADSRSAAATTPSGPYDEAIRAACSQIQFGAATSGLKSAKTVQEYQSEIGRIVSTLQYAEPGTGPQFTAHLQKLVDDLDAVSIAVGNGKDLSRFQAAVTADGSAVDMDCAAAGGSD